MGEGKWLFLRGQSQTISTEEMRETEFPGEPTPSLQQEALLMEADFGRRGERQGVRAGLQTRALTLSAISYADIRPQTLLLPSRRQSLCPSPGVWVSSVTAKEHRWEGGHSNRGGENAGTTLAKRFGSTWLASTQRRWSRWTRRPEISSLQICNRRSAQAGTLQYTCEGLSCQGHKRSGRN